MLKVYFALTFLKSILKLSKIMQHFICNTMLLVLKGALFSPAHFK